jgi:hypothetical protein
MDGPVSTQPPEPIDDTVEAPHAPDWVHEYTLLYDNR